MNEHRDLTEGWPYVAVICVLSWMIIGASFAVVWSVLS